MIAEYYVDPIELLPVDIMGIAAAAAFMLIG